MKSTRVRAGGSVRLLGVVFAIQVLCVASSCSQTDPVQSLVSQRGWLAHAGGPILQVGDLRKQGLWNDPSVLKEEGVYVMYMTSSVNEPFKPPILPFRAVSDNGIDWRLAPDTPLLDPSTTPFVSCETPSVVKFGGKYHLFFTGIFPEGTIPPMAVGHAQSGDGIAWEVSRQPLLEATGDFSEWNGYLVGEPGAVVHNDRLLVYFTALGARPSGSPPQLQSIGLVTSSDGKQFDAPRKVLGQAQAYPPEQGFVGYSTPSAFLLDGNVHLMVDVVLFQKGANPEWQQVALHHAVSADGEHGFVQDAGPIFTRRDFPWTSGEIGQPTVLVEDGQIKLWFAGHVALSELAPMINRGWKGPEFGIGFATMESGRFTKNSARPEIDVKPK